MLISRQEHTIYESITPPKLISGAHFAKVTLQFFQIRAQHQAIPEITLFLPIRPEMIL